MDDGGINTVLCSVYNSAKLDHYWNHVREIPDKGLLVSLHHSLEKSAEFEIYDVSSKDIKRVYSSDQYQGGCFFLHGLVEFNFLAGCVLVVGLGAITYSARRNIMAVIPLCKSVGYHLFEFGKDKNFQISLLRRAKWQSKHTGNDPAS